MTDDSFVMILGSVLALLGLVMLLAGPNKSLSLGLMLLGTSMVGRGLNIGSSTLWIGVGLLGIGLNVYGFFAARSRRS